MYGPMSGDEVWDAGLVIGERRDGVVNGEREVMTGVSLAAAS